MYLNTTINSLLPRFFCSGIQQIECLSPRNTIACGIALAALGCLCLALAALGCLCLYKYCKPQTPSPDLRNYIVITPYDGTVFEEEKTFEEMKELYDQAKRIIQSLPHDFKSKVNFNDRNLEIGIQYDSCTLELLANHEKLWWIFSAHDSFKPFPSDTIVDFVSNRFCVKALDELSLQKYKAKGELIRKAEDFFQNELEVQASPIFEKGIEFRTHEELLTAIFTKSKGLSIGEAHRQSASKFFLVSQMSTLVQQKVETLFMEGLNYESLQGDLDAYFHPDTPVDAIPLSIKYHYGWLEECLKSQGGNTNVDIIKEAKKAGIKRIVGIDTLVSDVDESRVLTMNYFAKQVIDRERPKGNYVIFSGAEHATTDSDSSTPGFSQIFGIPSILVYDGHLSMTHNTQGKLSTLGPFQGHVDFTVGISAEDRRKK